MLVSVAVKFPSLSILNSSSTPPEPLVPKCKDEASLPSFLLVIKLIPEELVRWVNTIPHPVFWSACELETIAPAIVATFVKSITVELDVPRESCFRVEPAEPVSFSFIITKPFSSIFKLTANAPASGFVAISI